MRALAVAACLLTVPAAFAASEIRVVQARTCNAQGQLYTPMLGDRLYGIRVDWTVTGIPNANYVVKFTVANQTWSFTATNRQGGNHWAYALFEMPLDGSIPARVSVDEAGVTGDKNLANNVITGPVVPRLPSNTLEYYDLVRLRTIQSFTVEWDGGLINSLSMYLGLPTTGTSQQVISSTLPTGATSVFLAPNNYPVSRSSATNIRPTVSTVEQRYTVTASAVRTNFDRLKNITWSNYNSVPTDVNRERQAEATIESTNAAVASFVTRNLPSNYRTTLRPVEAARLLYQATMKEITLDYGVQATAVGGLTQKKGDALTMNRVYAAALRNIGIPARIVGGWSYGRNFGEFWTEVFYNATGVGWVPQDPAYGELYDPTGTYPYGFSVIPIQNERTITQRGSNFQLESYTISSLLPGNFIYRGAATVRRYSFQSVVELAL